MSVLELNGRVFDASTTGTLTLTGEGGAATTDVTQGLSKAWLSLDGTGTISVTGSFNIGSTADNGTGNYTGNYTSNMSAADYTILGSLTGSSNVMHCVSSRASSSFTTIHRKYDNSLTDTKPMSAVVGDLA